jgi:hypothetical protein
MPLPQSMAALELANERRLDGAALKRSLSSMARRDAERVAADLLLEPTATVSGMRLAAFLLAVPRLGTSRLRALLVHAGIESAHIKIGQLTERQRRALASGMAMPIGDLRTTRVRQSPRRPSPRTEQEILATVAEAVRPYVRTGTARRVAEIALAAQHLDRAA